MEQNKQPILGLVSIPWPNWQTYLIGAGGSNVMLRRRENFDAGSLTTAWPVRVAFIENIQQVSYWNVQIQRYGTLALQPSRILGRRWMIYGEDPDFFQFSFTVLGSDYEEWIPGPGQEKPEPVVPFGADELTK